MTTDEIRKKFLKFFEERGHKIMPSSSLIPKDDPSVLLTTAGMQQFKKWFSGAEKPEYPRVATIQKCVRTSDIEEVGDETHLTYFEMLGNFSFNDYYKKEAIEYGWEFLTDKKWLGIEKDRIDATYFDQSKVSEPGHPAHVFDTDTESKAILERISGLKKIIPQGEDNFWTLGTPGSPGGPTVEFYVDGVEVWNLVFNEAIYKDQPSSHWFWDNVSKGVDTGMGLERLSAVINSHKSVYETDELLKVMKKIESNMGLVSEGDKEIGGADSKERRLITDHLRASVFLIADGVVPSKGDRGAVLRRLLRRAFDEFDKRQKTIGLNSNEEVVREIVRIYGGIKQYAYLVDELENIIKVVDNEKKFAKEELEKKLPRINKRIAVLNRYPNIDEGDFKWLKAAFIDPEKDNVSMAAGKFAYHLWNTHRYSKDSFLKAIDPNLEKRISSDDFEKGFDLGKERFQEVSRAGMDKKFVGGLANKEDPQIIKYHTAAHLMLAAMREILGDSVHQKGSNITAERLRFDFSWPEKLTDDQKKQVEDWVNDKIQKGLNVLNVQVDLNVAKEKGAVGEFSEKYGDKVKVYTIGPSASSGQAALDSRDAVSKEICGGPHVENTSELGHFKITKEESSSAGVRRIKAILE